MGQVNQRGLKRFTAGLGYYLCYFGLDAIIPLAARFFKDASLTPFRFCDVVWNERTRWCWPYFRDFVFAMQETDARPGEVRKAMAAHVNLDLGVRVFKERKSAKRIGRPRVIYLTPAMVELTRRLAPK
jgi:hypothetical protein